jgi:hypothetical protein
MMSDELSKLKTMAIKRMIESITVNGRHLLGADEAHWILSLPEVVEYCYYLRRQS